MTAAKILVTGAGGLLAADLIPVLRAAGHPVLACTRADLDVTDPHAVQAKLATEQPPIVVHCAAYTQVDAAERAPEEAWRINAEATRTLARACREQGATLAYLSTDYVFDGEASQPYPIDAPTGPLSAYGRSKLGGEEAVRQSLEAHFIIRTAWLYGAGGGNFVDTMRRLGRGREVVRVVDDQFGSPTWSHDLAIALAALLKSGRHGTYHATGTGTCSWFTLAQRVFQLEHLPAPLEAIDTARMARPAPRPRYSVLDPSSLALAGVAALPPWEESLARYLATQPFGGA
ncbi:MAG: dTDP-4-dehydrorhamnose reductase [Candidatus Sericytochromatia bacterium]|nr:dTDP-4-dehydrorhamnose reductase [Candidatus Sericytochromatia bacterium]